MRLRGLVAGVVLAVCGAGAAQADRIKAEIRFDGSGIPAMAKDAQVKVGSTVGAHLQHALGKWLQIEDFDSESGGTLVSIKLRGRWEAHGIPAENAEQLRKYALEAAASVPEAKLAIADFRISVEDDAHPKRDRREDDDDQANKYKARPQPRLDIEVKDKLIEDLTILDVPLVRCMDRLGAALPVAYVLHPEVVGRPVYVRLMGVTLDEALAAIAESAKVKIERREKYVAFVPLPAPGK